VRARRGDGIIRANERASEGGDEEREKETCRRCLHCYLGVTGLVRIPAPLAQRVHLRCAALADRDHFAPAVWQPQPLGGGRGAGVVGDRPRPPLAGGRRVRVRIRPRRRRLPASGRPVRRRDQALRRVSGRFPHRGRQARRTAISMGRRVRSPAHRARRTTPIVMYEMPVKWMSSDPGENPLVEPGTLEQVVFEQLDRLAGRGSTVSSCCPSKTRRRHWTGGTARGSSLPPTLT
jgi:hypothetical protein